MPYPTHALFSFGGDLLGGAEQWSNNIRFGASNITFTDSVGLEPDVLAYLMTQLSAVFSAPSTLGYSSVCRLMWGKFNQIGPDGHYRLGSDTVRQDITPISGSGSAIGLLPQAALAVSWGTSAERGRASKGRIFIPMPSVANGANGRITGTTAQNIATGWATLLTKFNDSPLDQSGADLYPAVVSGVDASFRRITHVKVGDVVDTMRSRRQALVEAYSVKMAVTDA